MNLCSRLVLTAGLLFALGGASLAARDITDHAGRKVTVPDVVKSYYTTSQIGIIALYALNPDKLAGWGFALNPGEKEYIPSPYHGLPVLGVWSGKNGSGNVEEIARIHPDVIFSIGVVDASQVALCDRIQKQTGIPVVVVDAPLTNLGAMFRLVGSVTGDQARAETLAAYADATIGRVRKLAAQVPPAKKVSVYYAEGTTGLETDPTGSFHTEVLDFVQGKNVADVLLQKGYGRSAVSPEQLLLWDPQVILAGNDQENSVSGASRLLNDPNWKTLQAVKNHRVYSIPVRPFDWFDRPPSVNRLIGTLWLFQVLYPELAPYDLAAEATQFYKLFYRVDLSADQLKALLGTGGQK